MRKQCGFSLIELLIVVTIILVISAIAIPNLMRSKIANESAAVSNVRRIAEATVAYAAAYHTGSGMVGYSSDLASLGGTDCANASATSACIIDNDLAKASTPDKAKLGYYYTYGLSDARGFTLNSDPATWGRTGLKHFYTDATQSIRFTNTDTPAGATDPAVQ